MRGGPLKRIGRIIICAVILLCPALVLGASVLETVIEDPSIVVGDDTTLRIKISGDADTVKPVKYPSVKGLRIEYVGMQRSFQYVNGKSWSGVELLFRVTGMRKGTYRIPPFIFRRGKETFQSGETVLAVIAGGDGGATEADVRTAVRLSADAAYVGQPVIMRYYLLSSGLRAAVRQINEHPDTRGFAIKLIEEPAVEGSGRDGAYDRSHVVSFALIPAGPGTYRVGGGSAVVSVEAPSQRGGDDFFGFSMPGMSRSQVMEFDTRPLSIRPLPDKGRPAIFQGDVGTFTLRAEFTDDPVKVFEEKKVTVTVEGSGNLLTMTRPVLEREVPGLKVIAEEGESSLKVEGGTLRGSRRFTYTLIPETAGAVKPGRIRLAFFDPDGGAYRIAETREIAFTATGNAAAREARFDNEKEERMNLNPLYIALILLAVAGGIVLVVMWERKRYRLAAGVVGRGAEREETAGISDEPDHLVTAARFAAGRDGDGFLKAAEKSLDQIRRAFDDRVPEDVEGAMARIRGEIYGYKYGRGSVSPEEMRRLHDELMELRQRQA